MTTSHSPKEKLHSPLGASTLSRIVPCPGSVKLCKGLPSITSKYAEEGTIAHEIAEDILFARKTLADIEPTTLYEPIKKYIDYVFSIQNIHTEVFIEHKFELTQIHEEMFGTSDAVIYNRYSKKLYVVDYKNGAGVPVEVENNLQLQFYALGALLSLKIPCETVEMVIVQPRCKHDLGPIRSWEVPSIHFVDFAADLKVYAKRTEEENAPLVGGKHCRFCPANKICDQAVKPEKIIKNPDPKKQFTVVTDELLTVINDETIN